MEQLSSLPWASWSSLDSGFLETVSKLRHNSQTKPLKKSSQLKFERLSHYTCTFQHLLFSCCRNNKEWQIHTTTTTASAVRRGLSICIYGIVRSRKHMLPVHSRMCWGEEWNATIGFGGRNRWQWTNILCKNDRFTWLLEKTASRRPSQSVAK